MTNSNDARLALPQAARVVSSQSIAQLADYVYPRGHLGYLSESESEALDQFKVILQERGYWTPGPPAPSHDDPLLLRFLRARRWVVEDAFGQFKDTEDWRKANDLDVLYRTIELDAYEQCRRLVRPKYPFSIRVSYLTIFLRSIPSGQAAATAEASPSTSSRSRPWTTRPPPSTSAPSPSRTTCRRRRQTARLPQACCACSRSTRT